MILPQVDRIHGRIYSDALILIERRIELADTKEQYWRRERRRLEGIHAAIRESRLIATTAPTMSVDRA